MQEDITQALQSKQWKQAAELIQAYLPEAKDEEKQQLSYNLIVSQINLKDAKAARKAWLDTNEWLNPSDSKELRREIKKLENPQPIKEKSSETKMTADGSIKKAGWFKSDTTLNDVIGLEKVKKELRKKIINPLMNPEVYRKYGAKIRGGAILYGSPGTGKTLLARAIAGETKANMLIVKIPEIVNKYAGSSEKNIATVFAQARQNRPAILFFDEMDGIFQSRESMSDISSGAMMKTIINTLLTELDGIQKDSEGIFVIGSTNMPQAVDSSVKRSGRFDETIYIPLPNLRDRQAMFKYYLKGLYTQKIDTLKLALASFGMSGSDIASICDNAAKSKASASIEGTGNKRPLTNHDFLKEIKEKGKPQIFEWMSKTLEEFRRMPAEQRNSYPDLKRDIKYWNKQGNADYKTQQFLSTIL